MQMGMDIAERSTTQVDGDVFKTHDSQDGFSSAV